MKIPGLPRKIGRALAAAAPARPPRARRPRLAALSGRFDNPGALRAFCHVPEGLPSGAPLVVVLHGCTQNAAGYDRGSGWSQLADRHGFALLFPEQVRSNNPNLCFNWYQPGDSARGSGEAASIRAMIGAMQAAHGLDPARTFVTGLSAGGAMAAAMLAAYPELFAAGAVIAGIPYGCASGLGEAFGCMGGRGEEEGAALAARVRAASPHRGPWPRLSVWHGSADRTVAPANADALVRQWAALHGLSDDPDRTDTVDGYPRRIWLDGDGTEAIEQYLVTGMGHGTPLMPGSGDGRSGEAMPHMLDVGLSSTDRIAAFFGIAPQPPATEASARRGEAAEPAAPRRRRTPKTAAAAGIQKTIEDALKAAGLMR